MAKKNAELETYLESHNVDVEPPKTDFRDTRMMSISCPLCATHDSDNLMKPIKFEEHPFGEFGFYQCDYCGCIMDLCNMTTKPTEFNLISKLVHGAYFQSVRSILSEYGNFSNMPKETSIHYVNAAKAAEAQAKDEKMDFCIECKSKFTPQKSCVAVREYCTTCRKEIPKDDERWKKDTKPKAIAKPKKVKKKSTSKNVKAKKTKS